jgi:adenylate cyclase
MNWKYLINDLKKALTPAGMAAFLKSHKYTLAISGVFSIVGLLMFVYVDLVGSRSAMFKLVRDYELRTLDSRFILRGARKGDERIVIVAIDQETINRLRWPFPRFQHAKLLDILCKDGARAIGMDIFFPFKDPTAPANVLTDLQKQMTDLGYTPDAAAFSKIEEFTKQADSDAQFAKSLKACGNVTLGHEFFEKEEQQQGMDPQTIADYNEILAYQAFPQIRKATSKERYRFFVEHPEYPGQQLDAKGILPNLKIFADASKYAGFINSFADSDSTFRRMPLIYRYPEKVRTQLEENFFPSLAVQTTRTYLNAGPDDTIFFFDQLGPSSLQLGNHTIHPDRSGQVLVNFAGPSKSYETYPFSEVVEGKLPPGTFKDKIVYIGITAAGIISDIRPTPFEKQSYPGVEIHANVSDNILHDDFLRRGYSEEYTNMVLVLFCGVVMGLVFVIMPATLGWAGFLGGLVLLLAYVYTQFSWHGRWVDVVIPSFTLIANFVGITSYRVIFEEREKRKVRGAFGMYVHPGLIGQMLKDPGLLKLGGEETELTVMFSDVRGFTSISEKLTPQQLVELLNEYLTAMSDTIMATWGTVDKYEGDAIMAFWGRPYPQTDHAERACKACLAMNEELNVLNKKWKSEGKQELNIGIGLNTGPMVVGNMGSLKRFNYTVMGDAVNLGARLEGQNKEYGTRILISEGTYAKVGNLFVCRELDLIRVKGKNKPVAIYELMASIEEAKRLEPLVQVFAEGLHAYRRGKFQAALEIFEDILSAYPNDGPAKVFAKRSKLYANEPPIGAWDGVFTATSK